MVINIFFIVCSIFILLLYQKDFFYVYDLYLSISTSKLIIQYYQKKIVKIDLRIIVIYIYIYIYIYIITFIFNNISKKCYHSHSHNQSYHPTLDKTKTTLA